MLYVKFNKLVRINQFWNFELILMVAHFQSYIFLSNPELRFYLPRRLDGT